MRALIPVLVALPLLVACGNTGGDDRGGEATAAGAATTPKAYMAAEPVLLPVPDDPTISFMVWFKVGSWNDPPGKEGLAYVTAHLLAEGATTENAYEDILAKLYPLASSYQTRVDREMTTLWGRTHKDNVEKFFKLFTEAYTRPAFEAADFERIRKDALNTIKNTLRFASDEELGKAAFFDFVYRGTPYAHPSVGTVKGLESLTLDDVKAFYRTWFSGSNAVIALGGGYDDGLVRRMQATLQTLPAGQPPASPAVRPEPVVGHRVRLVDKPGADASISFGFPLDVHRGERAYYALWLANSWLGEHRNSSSHLYQVIRSRRGLNYGDYSYIEAYPEGGFRQMPPTNVARHHQCFEVWIRTLPNEQAVFALRAALRELHDLITGGMSKEEFELTQSFLDKYSLHFAETTLQRLGYAVDDRFYGIEGSHLERFRKTIRSLTRDEVNAAVRRYLQDDNLKIAMVTGDAALLQRQLTSGEPTPIDYPTPKPDAILAEDKEIAAFPLDIAPENVEVIKVTDIFEQ